MLKNKVVVVTGGAGLIGQEFVKAIVSDEGTAIIADINESSGIQTVEKLKFETGSTSIDYYYMDITNKESIDKSLVSINKKYGKIDSVVNNAYPRNNNYGRKFEDVEYSDFCDNVSLHLGGYFLVCQRFAVFFKSQGYGNIVNISSIYGIIAPRFEIYNGTSMTTPVEYAAIKSAIIHLTKYLAKYYKGERIRVNSLSLGGISNNQPQLFIKEYEKFALNKGMLDKADVTGSLLFLLSDKSEYINGHNLIVDDGWTL